MIDLRSDTVTRPSQGMRKAMYEAEVGDDVFREDPTVRELEEYVASLFGKEAALFVTSGVMGNQLCLNLLTSPGNEVICETEAHIFNYESGSPGALSGIQLYPIQGERGVLSVEQIEKAIRPKEAYYMPRTAVVTIENTHNRASGAVQPIENIRAVRELALKYKLKTHLDGARIWNAHIASGVELREYARYFDTVSACFSKGLGAPVGSIIISDKERINEAFRLRKGWGGGMRQVGIIAAAALYAVKNNIQRLSEDHENAKLLALRLAEMKNIHLNPDDVQTNIILFEPLNKTVPEALEICKKRGVLLSAGNKTKLRAVTHMDVTKSDIEKAAKILSEIFGK